ncbi:hypothetical protein [Flavobacterium antarcticum]|uniref:hypothetical protein n=1 Tax=Flavobacterium antarcticum TaxID=271155 RepID=UPI0012FB709F|nr:hypothetical protein [Flavobacterium antarcticum]
MILIIVANISFCNAQTPAKSEVIQTDYSKSAGQAIELIKEKIMAKNISEFIVAIESVHNGIYISISKIQKIENKIKVKTSITNASGKNSESVKKYSIQEFITILDNLIKTADNQLVFAGTYQKIKIIDDDKEFKIHTRKAYGLINLMR